MIKLELLRAGAKNINGDLAYLKGEHAELADRTEVCMIRLHKMIDKEWNDLCENPSLSEGVPQETREAFKAGKETLKQSTLKVDLLATDKSVVRISLPPVVKPEHAHLLTVPGFKEKADEYTRLSKILGDWATAELLERLLKDQKFVDLHATVNAGYETLANLTDSIIFRQELLRRINERLAVAPPEKAATKVVERDIVLQNTLDLYADPKIAKAWGELTEKRARLAGMNSLIDRKRAVIDDAASDENVDTLWKFNRHWAGEAGLSLPEQPHHISVADYHNTLNQMRKALEKHPRGTKFFTPREDIVRAASTGRHKMYAAMDAGNTLRALEPQADALRKEIAQLESGQADPEDNPLRNDPHTVEMVLASQWSHPYSREQAALPAAWLRERKFWPAVALIDNALGDRQLVCTCAPVDCHA